MCKNSFSKFFVKSFILVVFVFTLVIDAKAFTDVNSSTKNSEAIMDLYNRGIITGYDDGSFKPEKNITRGEVAIIMSKAFGYSDESASASFKDVPVDAWIHPYVMRAFNASVMSGVGDNYFGPNAKITHSELIKMAVSQIGKSKLAELLGGWPNGYESVARAIGIVDGNVFGSSEASRADVCEIVSQVFKYQDNKGMLIDGKNIDVGMTTSELETPDEVVHSIYKDVDWYFYNIDDYKNFYALLVKSDVVFGYASVGDGFLYKGKKAGDVYNRSSDDFSLEEFFTDKYDGNSIHAVYNRSLVSRIDKQYNDFSGVSKANFHFTNALRVFHNKRALTWDDRLAEAARLHSQDMADRNYFSHVSPDGERFVDRYQKQGLPKSGGENIYCSTSLDEFLAYNGWVNSEGHRKNMLANDYEYMGVGGAYNKNSEYGFYLTQNFAFRIR